MTKIEHIEEPVAKVEILVPSDMVGNVMELVQNRRGVFQTMTYLDETRVDLSYTIPLSEIIFDFFDKLKSSTKGYASLDYQLSGYQKTDAVKLDILLNGDLIDALSIIVHRSNAAARGRSPAKTLSMWDRVLDGETRYIKGFKTTADFLLDTSFTYELGLISRLLGEVRRQFTLEGHNAELWDETARRFEQVDPLPLELLPADSMLREFYGSRA